MAAVVSAVSLTKQAYNGGAFSHFMGLAGGICITSCGRSTSTRNGGAEYLKATS